MGNLRGATVAICFAALQLAAVQGQELAKSAAPAAEAKGIQARSAPSDYQTQGKAGNVTIAADFVGHSVPTPEATLSTEDYVVLEVAVYGPADTKLKLSIDDFTLRLSTKKKPLASQPSELVFKSLKDPEWNPPEPKEKKSKTSFGGGGEGESSTPAPVHVPLELRRTMSQRVERASFPQGERPLPQAGLLFFDYHGKVQTIHSIELVYKGPAGETTLTLNP